MYTISNLRVDEKLTKKDLAKILGVPYTTYLAYENGLQAMPAYIFAEICDYFNISRDELVIPNYKQRYSPLTMEEIDDFLENREMLDEGRYM